MLQIIPFIAACGNWLCNSRSISNNGFSAISASKSNFGLKLHTCLHISEPMEPPAPVTRIILSLAKASIRSRSSSTTSLRSRSLISTFRIRETSVIDGTVRNRIFVPAHTWITRLSSLGSAAGIAMATSSMLRSLQILGSCSTVPSTGIPWIFIPCLTGSLSIKPITSYSVTGMRWISRSSASPVLPAPIMRNLFNRPPSTLRNSSWYSLTTIRSPASSKTVANISAINIPWLTSVICCKFLRTKSTFSAIPNHKMTIINVLTSEARIIPRRSEIPT